MSTLTESYLKVQYDVRPAKQAERRMFVDALQILSLEGFPIRDYQYTGMGSIYFVDFILFHKILGIERMLSVEASEHIEKRIKFNKPYKNIQVEVGRIGDFIPSLSRDLQHLLWLDYDCVVEGEILRDIAQAVTHLSVGSILLVTVDAEGPGPPEDGAAEWCEYFKKEVGEYLPHSIKPTDFGKEKLPRLYADLIEKSISLGIRGIRDVEFLPLFHFVYKDSRLMLTIGGMIATGLQKRRVQQSKLKETRYYRKSFKSKPCKISVPSLTKKERMFLDNCMPCRNSWKINQFELSKEDLLAYREVYRFLPAYAEFLL